MVTRYEQFDHGADVGVRGFGPTAAEAFEGAAAALFTLLSDDLSAIRLTHTEKVDVQAPDLEQLLVAFLNELLSLADAKRIVFGRFSVAISGGGSEPYRLSARADGEPFDPTRHEFTVVPKGATFTALRVAQQDDGWVAQCVVDV